MNSSYKTKIVLVVSIFAVCGMYLMPYDQRRFLFDYQNNMRANLSAISYLQNNRSNKHSDDTLKYRYWLQKETKAANTTSPYHVTAPSTTPTVSSDSTVSSPTDSMSSTNVQIVRIGTNTDDENIVVNGRRIPVQLYNLAATEFDNIPHNFSSEFKNPCWYRMKILHCLPYFYLLGIPKSGTTDLWSKILSHPTVVKVGKEPHWWTRMRIGSGDSLKSFDKYTSRGTSFYSQANKKERRNYIFGDGSASTLWDNQAWRTWFPSEKNGTLFTISDIIHTLQPLAKLLIILREPVSRLYSDYNYFNGKTSPEEFHKHVVDAIQKYHTCLSEHPFRFCIYSHWDTNVRLHLGIYWYYINEWLRLYPRQQLMVIELGTWNQRCGTVLLDVYKFLDIDPLDDKKREKLCSQNHANSNYKNTIPMLPATNKLLEEFYSPHNEKLSFLLQDPGFMYRYDSTN